MNFNLTSINWQNSLQTTPFTTTRSERERFLVELTTWENNMPGENRGDIARKTLAAYDEAMNSPSESVILDFSQTAITELPPLPAGLNHLVLSKTPLTALPANLPIGLTYLNLSETRVTALPANLPAGLTVLDLSRTPVTALPANLPAGLTFLYLSDTPITALPENLPAGLHRIQLVLDVTYNFNRINRNRTPLANLPAVDEPFALPNELWDNHVAHRIQTAASRNQALYNEEGALSENFANQKPESGQIEAITSWISTNLALLDQDGGMEVGDKKLTFANKMDPITCVEFEINEAPGQNTEWCLLSQGGNIFNFITAETATTLIHSGNTHPITRMPLASSDFIRGEALLMLLNGDKKG